MIFHQIVSQNLFSSILNCLFLIPVSRNTLSVPIQMNGYYGIWFQAKICIEESNQATNYVKKSICENKIRETIWSQMFDKIES